MTLWQAMLDTAHMVCHQLGHVSVLLQTALLYPLELAATRLAADTAAKAEKRLYTGLLHCLQQTYYAEGPRGAS